MAMVNVVTYYICQFRSVAQADWLIPRVGGRQALVLYSSDEPGELSQWLCHVSE